MTTYTAYFRTDSETATHTVEADSPEQALSNALELYTNDPSELWFEPYDGGMPVNKIAIISDNHDEVAAWLDDDLRLRLAASDLLEALEFVAAGNTEIERLEAIAKAAIAKANGGAL